MSEPCFSREANTSGITFLNEIDEIYTNLYCDENIIKNSIKVKTVGGDGVLGGDIFDTELFKEILEAYKTEGGNPMNIAKKNYRNKKK